MTEDKVSCAACGREIPPGARFCRFCGTSAHPTSAEAPKADGDGGESVAVEQVTAPEPHCPDCDNSVPADARFCRHCGAALRPQLSSPPALPGPQREASQQAFDARPACSRCGVEATSDQKFCRGCGAALAGAMTAAPAIALDALPAPATPATTSSGGADPTLRVVLIAVIAFVIVVGLAGTAYAVLLKGDDSEEPVAADVQTTSSESQSSPAQSGDAPTDDGSAILSGEPSSYEDEVRQTLMTFHEAIVDGEYQTAWNVLTQRKRDKELRGDGYGTWRKAQASLTRYLDPSAMEISIEDLNPTTGVARVDVSGMTWSAPKARCSEWSGLTWVKYEDGEWKYDPGYSTTPQREREWKNRYDELLGAAC